MSESAFQFVGLSAVPDNICFSVYNNKNEKVCWQWVFFNKLESFSNFFQISEKLAKGQICI